MHLKSMITVWLLNQHDTYREVRAAAQTSFKVPYCCVKVGCLDCFLQAAIPKKAAEALLFCKQEILTQLTEYLAHTPQTLSALLVHFHTCSVSRFSSSF